MVSSHRDGRNRALNTVGLRDTQMVQAFRAPRAPGIEAAAMSRAGMAQFRQHDRKQDLVILVHGLWMHGAVCAPLAYRLRRAGFRVALFSYRSLRESLDDIGDRLHAYALHRAPARVHFVGHSLGGLVILNMLARFRDLPSGRTVLLGSPCNDCETARQLSARSVGSLLLGRALRDWSPPQGEEAARRVSVGVLAGTRRIGMGRFLVSLRGANDGVVLVDETALRGAADHLTLAVSHSGMLLSKAVAEQTVRFLREGAFAHRARTQTASPLH